DHAGEQALRHRGPAGRRAAAPARRELRRVRHRAARPRHRGTGHRAHHRPGAGSHAAGAHDRVRRQPHQHARRVRRSGVRGGHQRMTVCNMSIEAGARAGMIAPDDTTFEYLAKTPRAPKGAAWDRALASWRALPSDAGAAYHRAVAFDGSALEPMITYGTNPGM